MKKSQTQNQKKMYTNPLLELLSQSGPLMMTVFHLTLISTFLYQGIQRIGFTQSFLIPLLFFGAFFLWTFAEYLLHRYVFHFVREDSKLVRVIHFTLHGYHHQEPTDAKRLFMPPVPAILILTLFFGIYYLIMKDYAWIFLAGFESGYLVYAFIHYLIHTQKAPKFFRALWKHHALHHFKYPDKAFGVSTRVWDRIFQTMPPTNEEPHPIDVRVGRP